MGIFIDYVNSPYSDLKHIPTVLATADPYVTLVTSLTVCNTRSTPMRFNLDLRRSTGRTLEKKCYVGTTGNLSALYTSAGDQGRGDTLTNTGAFAVFTLDGVTPPPSSRILVKDQTAQLENGIYILADVGSTLTPWVLVRALDFDRAATVNREDVIPVLNGSTNVGTKWEQTATVSTVGVDPIIFALEVPTIYSKIITELELHPYETKDIIDITGVLTLQYSVTPYISDNLYGFSNGYTQVFDSRVNLIYLKELP